MNDPQAELLTFLKTVDLFRDLKDSEIISLLPYIHEENISEGKWIFKEGEIGHCLCIVKEGSGEIIKEDPTHEYREQLSIVHPGEYVGEMAYLEKSGRAASFRALEPIKILIFELDQLSKIEQFSGLHERLVNKMASKVSKDLRRTNENLIVHLGEKLNLIHQQAQFGDTIVYIFIWEAFYLNVMVILNTYFTSYSLLHDFFYPFSIFFFALGNFYIILKSKRPLSFYGLNLNNWKRQVYEGVVYSIPLLGIGVLVKYLMITYVPALQSMKLINLLGYSESPHFFFISLSLYIAMVPIQELIVRGFLQTCFRNFFQSPNRVFLAILCSNLFFELGHALRSFWLGVFVFVFGLWWGYLYERHKSIVGVSISHIIFGVSLFFIFDFLAIFQALFI